MVDNKTFGVFFWLLLLLVLQLVYCLNVSAAQQSTPGQQTPSVCSGQLPARLWDPALIPWDAPMGSPTPGCAGMAQAGEDTNREGDSSKAPPFRDTWVLWGQPSSALEQPPGARASIHAAARQADLLAHIARGVYGGLECAPPACDEFTTCQRVDLFQAHCQ